MARRLLKLLHPEALPIPGTFIYSALTRNSIFQQHYALVASDIVRLCPAGKLVDVGTGPGWLLIHLRRLAPKLETTGIDISPAMVRRAQSNLVAAGLADLRVAAGEAKSLPFPDASLDAIVSTGSLHHWKEPQAALREFFRTLKPGGLALIYDIVRDTPQDILANLRRDFGHFRGWMFWLHAFEEPFLSIREMSALPLASPFARGTTRFVGALCCLELRKPAG